jgi:chromosome partitioning protein
MPVIVVANPKGGVGKSTLSTNIAGYLAQSGHAVMLGDVDRQQSARTWLSLRPANLPAITGWELNHDEIVRPPRGTTHAVLDTPAGLHGKRLDEVMKLADKVLVPLQPSIFDIHATHAFVRELLARRRGDKVSIAIVGMRVRDGTISADQLRSFLETLQVPLLGFLRDTQNYVHLAARGLTLWDVAPSRVERDIEQWKPLLQWLEQG